MKDDRVWTVFSAGACACVKAPPATVPARRRSCSPPRRREHQQGLILDVGAGSGAVGLMAALRAPGAIVGLVEIDPESCALARENVAENALGARATVYQADVLAAKSRRAAGLIDEKAALVLTNPPFHDAGKVRATPDAAKARAHVASAPLMDWVRACLALLAPSGTFVMIHRADALAECLAAVRGQNRGRVDPAHSHAGRRAGDAHSSRRRQGLESAAVDLEGDRCLI